MRGDPTRQRRCTCFPIAYFPKGSPDCTRLSHWKILQHKASTESPVPVCDSRLPLLVSWGLHALVCGVVRADVNHSRSPSTTGSFPDKRPNTPDPAEDDIFWSVYLNHFPGFLSLASWHHFSQTALASARDVTD
jgi:hypothetical protein